MRVGFLLLFALCLPLPDQVHAQVCICLGEISSLNQFREAKILVIARVKHVVPPDNASPNGQTEVILDDVLLPHALIKGKKVITLPLQLKEGKARYLIAMDVYKGKVEPYFGVILDAKGEIERYIRGGLRLKDKTALGRLRYSADFLASENQEVANAAYSEFTRVGYPDFRKAAEKLRPAPLLKAIQDPKTPPARVSSLAVLLGHCGKKEHAAVLKKSLAARKPSGDSGYGLMVGYVLLQPTEGWKFVSDLAVQEKKGFSTRYGAFATIRFFREQRTDIVDAKKCAFTMARILDVPDMADFAVEELRKWRRWEFCDRILHLPHKNNSPIVRKNVLRYALQCPSQSAKAYVQMERNRDAEFVAETKELLDLEK
ncbi:MAG: hypothetical protein HYX68_16505 [Planctomycetes bacterium]|nr:hypothetical protein [Planctomycetota bacterium]